MSRSSLTVVETLYSEWDYSMACDFRDHQYSASYATARRLLTYADLPLVYRARALMVLATQRNTDNVTMADAVTMAEEAVRILDQDVRQLVTAAARPFPGAQFAMAKAVLATAQREAHLGDTGQTIAQPAVESSDTSRRPGAKAVAKLAQDVSNVSLETTTTVGTTVSEGQMSGVEIQGMATKSKKSRKRKKKTKPGMEGSGDVTSAGFWTEPSASHAVMPEADRPSLIRTPRGSRETTPVPTETTHGRPPLTPASAFVSRSTKDNNGPSSKKKQKGA